MREWGVRGMDVVGKGCGEGSGGEEFILGRLAPVVWHNNGPYI